MRRAALALLLLTFLLAGCGGDDVQESNAYVDNVNLAQSRFASSFERLARDSADVRAMGLGDLAEIVRIDRVITGRDRREYMTHKLNETMVDSAIRVSLTARLDGAIVGFLMARAVAAAPVDLRAQG